MVETRAGRRARESESIVVDKSVTVVPSSIDLKGDLHYLYIARPSSLRGVLRKDVQQKVE